MSEFRMPSLGADMDFGTVLEWRVAPGDTVHRGDIVAVVDTEKSTIEVEVFEDGVVEELVVAPGVEVPVGTVLARLGPLGALEPATLPPATLTPAVPPAALTTEPAATAPAGPARAPAGGTGAAPVPPPPSGPAQAVGAFVRASPRARRRAAVAGVDLGAVRGTGPQGAVVYGDLDREPGGREPAEGAQTAAVPVASTEYSGPGRRRQDSMRHAIAVLMARSKREIPHYYLGSTVDLGDALDWMAALNATRPVERRLLPAALLLRATSLAAREHPAMNGFFLEEFRPSAGVHLGVAVSLRGGGLVAPAIHDADRLDLDGVMAALKDLTRRARAGGLRSSEMADPTITVTSLGDLGAEEVFGVIYPPQVALVGFGRIVERPWARGGMLGVRPVVRVTLAGDHRVSDGHEGGRFLATIGRLLQDPPSLAKEVP